MQRTAAVGRIQGTYNFRDRSIELQVKAGADPQGIYIYILCQVGSSRRFA